MNRGLYILLIGLVIQGISAGIQSKRKFNSKILMKKKKRWKSIFL